jgi:hypothetical protein
MISIGQKSLYAGVIGVFYAGVTGQTYTPELQVLYSPIRRSYRSNLYAGVTGIFE